MLGQAKKIHNILIVDDEEMNVVLMQDLCEHLGYATMIAWNGAEALQQAREKKPDLILMDIMMPVMNGLTATEKLKTQSDTSHIPVIMVTALDSRKDRLEGIFRGANDFITKPVDREELSLRIKNNLVVKDYHDFIANHNRLLEEEVASKTKKLQKAYKALEISYRQSKASHIETIQKLNLAAEYKDEDTGAHLRRISLYSSDLAHSMGLDGEFAETLFYASPMHDLGKVGIPDYIMLKPGPLSPDEWRVMKSHTTIGSKILCQSNSRFLQMAEDIALTHHEKWDGRGYPRGLKGESIPLCGRIVNIVDQYDALRSKRPYKMALPHESAVRIITEGDVRTSPHDFDPEVLNAFKRSAARFHEIFMDNAR